MKRYLTLILLFLLTAAVSCKDREEAAGDAGEPDGMPVRLTGTITRADGDPRTDIYVKAFFKDSENIFFNETLAELPDGLTPGQVTDLVFPQASPYYPLDKDREIAIIAYSGKAPDGKMYLTAGTASVNDAVLSNYGRRESDTEANDSYEPEGTIGSAADPVAVLQFRHVMTQLVVTVVVDDTEDPKVDPIPQKVEFTMPTGVVTTGRYAVREKLLPQGDGGPMQLAVETSTDPYTVKLGVNYLIPTGENLLGQALRTLVIDDYTALPEDLTGYTIEALEGQTAMELLPGYAYELVLTISRLRLNGLTLSKTDWQATERDSDLEYTPYDLNLDMGNYDNSGDKTVTRVVLRTTDNKEYVGKASGAVAEFVIKPDPSHISGVSLYTDFGLLLDSEISPADYDGTTLTLPLSVGGMVAEDPAAPVTEDNPYMINTTVQFMNVNDDLTTHYKMAGTIDLSTLNLISGTRIFNGFGDFSGSFDGNGCRIDEVDIVAPGLFRTNSGTLKNIRLTSGTLDATGYDYAGSICYKNTGTIMACVNEAQITNVEGTSTIMGGIVGQNSGSGRVLGCVNTGYILEGNVIGGICGENLSVSAYTFVSCINTGTLNPQSYDLGFICGKSADAAATNVIQSCFGLVGSAQHVIGSPEIPVGEGTVGYDDTSALEPRILRNDLPDGISGDENRVVNRLNAALADHAPAVAAEYVFIYDDPTDPNDVPTGITWPAPVMR